MKKEYRKTSNCFSFLIQALYGTLDYTDIKNYQTPRMAKTYYLKVIKSIRFSVNENLKIIDNQHLTDILELIDQQENFLNACNDFNTLDQAMISFQSELIFLLLGEMPNRWQKERVINKKENWRLNYFRSIQYIQNDEQKTNLLFNMASNNESNERKPNRNKLRDIFISECKCNHSAFIIWMRKNYPEAILKII